jgi:ferritin-like metal-binding protein YciE
MKLRSLEDLFVAQLRGIYHAENQLLKALPRMARAANAPELRAAFEEHLEQTRLHAERLEQVFDQLGAKAKGKKCEAMKGLVAEGKDLIDADPEAEPLDAGLIDAAQKVEHYEIAAYGTLCAWAKHLGQEAAFGLLHQTLGEEKAADEKLTRLAEARVNPRAEQQAGQPVAQT